MKVKIVVLVFLLSIFAFSQKITKVYNLNRIKFNTDSIKVLNKNDFPELFPYLNQEEFSDKDTTIVELDGYRIQLFKSTDMEEAKEKKAFYEKVLKNRNIYLLFNEPLFKIRMGDFKYREDAEAEQIRLKSLNYRNPLIVPDKIKVVVIGKNK
ncbi:MAG: hypothetical protein CR982_03945 [Candidatus Cloacimonadota bacterium]|nr:MAG: hypothetical protein CR982_03945 [Candidatus Cloacimonadota bacterium]PIE77684.1 MAG: hypothetical protein CSA15_11725 [Candidatus Delongbacteria bacterium]